MIPSVLSQQLHQGITDFLKTTFPVSTTFFHGIVDRLLEEKEGIFKGPFLTLQLPFRMGEGKTEFSPDFTIDFTPYLHQELAFERLSGVKPKSTIVAIGKRITRQCGQNLKDALGPRKTIEIQQISKFYIYLKKYYLDKLLK